MQLFIHVFTNSAHSASSLSCDKLLGCKGPLLLAPPDLSDLLPPDTGVRTFSHPDDNTPLSSPLTRLGPVAWELTHFLESFSAAELAKPHSSLDFRNLDRLCKGLVDDAFADLGGMVL